jgi:xylulokinase
MASTPCFLAIDLTPDGLILLLQDRAGAVIDQVRRSIAVDADGAQDPNDWWRAVRTGTKDLLRRADVRKDDVRAVGVTAVEAGVVPLGADGALLATCRLFSGGDQEEDARRLAEAVGARNLVNLTGGAATSGCLAAQLLRLRERQPRVWHDLAYALTPRDFLRQRLTGAAVSDAATASSTRLFSPRGRAWSKQVLDRLQIEARWLPPIQPGHILSGRVTPQAAREVGLVPGTPVVVGAGRAAAMTVAAGALAPGDLVVELGGPGLATLITDKPARSPSGIPAVGCHALPDLWTLDDQGATAAAGIEWLTQQVLATDLVQWRRTGRQPLDMIADLAATAPIGAGGLLLLPPRSGGREGGIHGLTSVHGRAQVMRGLLEGGAIALAQGLRTVEAAGTAVQRITVVGESADTPLWCQIVADVLGRPVRALPIANPRAHGAAVLAGVAIGVYKSVAEGCAACLPEAIAYEPEPEAVAVYAALMEQHRGVLAAAPVSAAAGAADL